ncbi:hypothetical protein LW135_01835 [Helicobacter sp. faydin-H20]|uniref:hypothetical protein n=1 Tax=Helicobacter anatolicus TaxID=2905874 RepID=UPI001E53FDB1|nr:hypothetical protein [Helicobacter anatolicus]MCE3036575.1 hypothetical protein [Helicobacter anatolicus]
MKKIILGFTLFASSVFGVHLGNFQITPEIGGNIGYEDTSHTKFTYGGYARIWLGVSRFVIAPQAKYDVMYQTKGSFKNLQVGGVLGFEVPVIPITPYVGASWSTFYNIGLGDTVALNYGIKLDVPLIPFLTIGIDGVYQAPKVGGSRFGMNRIGVTLGLAF